MAIRPPGPQKMLTTSTELTRQNGQKPSPAPFCQLCRWHLGRGYKNSWGRDAVAGTAGQSRARRAKSTVAPGRAKPYPLRHGRNFIRIVHVSAVFVNHAR